MTHINQPYKQYSPDTLVWYSNDNAQIQHL